MAEGVDFRSVATVEFKTFGDDDDAKSFTVVDFFDIREEFIDIEWVLWEID